MIAGVGRADRHTPFSEILAPSLPIVTANDSDEAIEFIDATDHPLVLCVFTDDSKPKGNGEICFSPLTMTYAYQDFQSLATLAAEVCGVVTMQISGTWTV